jgi:hypothetical protein
MQLESVYAMELISCEEPAYERKVLLLLSYPTSSSTDRGGF